MNAGRCAPKASAPRMMQRVDEREEGGGRERRKRSRKIGSDEQQRSSQGWRGMGFSSIQRRAKSYSPE